ncbi:hypothetical protein SBA4_880041 [Candidatus Sulfopaludibacter sp. SbA4]|nr:hypothetical protein SBA4_880041 [Candidatus Sulfopaludibacter sp. SbA4]
MLASHVPPLRPSYRGGFLRAVQRAGAGYNGWRHIPPWTYGAIGSIIKEYEILNPHSPRRKEYGVASRTAEHHRPGGVPGRSGPNRQNRGRTALRSGHRRR